MFITEEELDNLRLRLLLAARWHSIPHLLRKRCHVAQKAIARLSAEISKTEACAENWRISISDWNLAESIEGEGK